MDLKRKTDSILNKYGLRAKKRFGQNFLIDENIIENIIEKSNISETDLVIEIGPGIGNMTEYLLNTGCNLIAFEIDDDMVEILNNRFNSFNNFTLVKEDILKSNLDDYISKFNKYDKIKVVANLPYYITTPIIFKLFEDLKDLYSITIMVQKEVADRIIAKPNNKDYGILTINTSYYGIPEKLFDVPNTSFIPSPNVTSSVVKILLQKRYNIKDERLFFNLIKSSFAQRRKKLINSLDGTKFNDFSKQELNDILRKCNIDEMARAEQLSIEDYVTIANYIKVI